MLELDEPIIQLGAAVDAALSGFADVLTCTDPDEFITTITTAARDWALNHLTKKTS